MQENTELVSQRNSEKDGVGYACLLSKGRDFLYKKEYITT